MLAVDRWIEKHPEWFDQPRIDIEEGHEGWRQLIDNAFSLAEQILSDDAGASFRIVQVKEKFGALRIYFREKGLPTEVFGSVTRNHAIRERSVVLCLRKFAAHRRVWEIDVDATAFAVVVCPMGGRRRGLRVRLQ